MKLKFHHVAITVRNIEKSVKWYKDKLDFKVLHDYEKHGMHIVQLKKDEVRLELFHFSKATKTLPNYRKELMNDLHVLGTKHLCIEVDDLDAIIKYLKSKGVTFATQIDTAGFGGRYIFFKDCNGILIELYES